MYEIKETYYGYRLKFKGVIDYKEMSQWVLDSDEILRNNNLYKFGVFADLRDLQVIDEKTRQMMERGQKMYKIRGLTRSVVIVKSKQIKAQFKRTAKLSGIYKWERYIDVESTLDWDKKGINWITLDIDPDVT